MSRSWRVMGAAVVAGSVLALTPGVASADPVPGRFCKKTEAGQSATYNGVTVVCTRDGKRYRWLAGQSARAVAPASVKVTEGAVCTQAQVGKVYANRLRCTFMGSKAPARWVRFVPGAVAGVNAG